MQVFRWVLLCSILSTGALGQVPPPQYAVPSIGYVQSTDLSGNSNIFVSCYYDPAVVPTCAGGGDFDLVEVGSTCQALSADDVTIVKDGRTMGHGGPDCFHRRNFGLNGIVDARQCGIVGDG